MPMEPKDFWAPRRGAVSLTFDDGTNSQMDVAIPLMDRCGVRGTFFVSLRDYWYSRQKEWQAAAGRGHEIGNHSMVHFAPNNFVLHGGLEDMTLQQVEQDILEAQKSLEQIFPHQKRWTYAYPCYQTHVGKGLARQSYEPVVAKYFIAGRGRGEYGFGNNPLAVDLACAWGHDCTLASGFEMIGMAEEIAVNRGHWLILVFHDIDGSRLTTASHDFNMLLEHLQRRSDVLWTAPMGEVAARIVEVGQP
jgi:peptidoglycan/xylan/chitin deacetylase (PgdA/CDA1 family)